jgi:hypothetical protein
MISDPIIFPCLHVASNKEVLSSLLTSQTSGSIQEKKLNLLFYETQIKNRSNLDSVDGFRTVLMLNNISSEKFNNSIEPHCFSCRTKYPFDDKAKNTESLIRLQLMLDGLYILEEVAETNNIPLLGTGTSKKRLKRNLKETGFDTSTAKNKLKEWIEKEYQVDTLTQDYLKIHQEAQDFTKTLGDEITACITRCLDGSLLTNENKLTDILLLQTELIDLADKAPDVILQQKEELKERWTKFLETLYD